MHARDLATAALAAIVTGAAPCAVGAQQLPPFVEFRVPKAPTVAAVGDSIGALVYELHITNFSAGVLTLTRVEVLNDRDGRILHSVADTALVRDMTRPGQTIPAAERMTNVPKIAGGARATVFLWVPVDRRNPPASVRQRLTFTRAAPDTSVAVLEGSVVQVNRNIAVIGPPLRGDWLAVNGPSNASGHRRTTVALNGLVTIPQRFGIDFLQLDDQASSFRTDRTKNENFYAEGNDVLAVADGIVVDTKDSIPENVPGGRAVPITLITVGGNYIVLDIGNSNFAFYAHLKPGSQRVRVGDRVKRGQVIGLVGNSGNSTEPHLHFHMSDALAPGTTTLGSEGMPYAIGRLETLGRCAMTAGIGPCTSNTPVTIPNAMPMQNQLVRFPR